MDEKIKLYEEMLSLDPASKLFLRLAELYCEKNDFGRALEVLERGLEGHPEYLEARFCLLRVCQSLGLEDRVAKLMDDVVQLFKKYADFWFYWSKHLQHRGQKDLALLVGLLGAALQDNKGLSLTDIVLHFLNSSPSPAFTETAQKGSAFWMENDRAADVEDKSAQSAEGAAVEADVPGADSTGDEDFEFSLADGFDDLAEGGGIEGVSAVRTKSMADILVEQGDLEQARDIYRELLLKTEDEQERVSIQRALDGIDLKLAGGEETGQTERADRKRGLQAKLARLAERLEARAMDG